MTVLATNGSLSSARVAGSMTRGVICCRPETPLREVAAIMAQERVHAVYVFVPDGAGGEPRLWGLVSDLDLVAAARSDLDALTASDAAVTPLVTIGEDDTLDLASQFLAENGVSHLAVVDPFSRLPIGVLSTLDIARYLAGSPL
jgi:CBS domain-containing protein